MIEVDGLNKSFDELRVLKNIDFRVDPGTVVALLGASGAGKSVLLRILVGLMDPDAGSVTIGGTDVHRASASRLEDLRDRVGMLFQHGALFDSMSVYENLAFPLREKTDLDEEEIADHVSHRLELVDLAGTGEKYPAELSGGMQKRVALARALVRDPEVIFFDEPTTGLDPLTGNAMLRLIHDLHERLNFTGFIVTHDLDKVRHVVDEVAMLYNGEIVAREAPEDFLELDREPVIAYVREIMDGPLAGADSDGTVD